MIFCTTANRFKAKLFYEIFGASGINAKAVSFVLLLEIKNRTELEMNRLKQVLLGCSSQDSQVIVTGMSDRCSVFSRRFIHATTQGEGGQLLGSYHSGRKA
jgi:hypothetical protein